MTLIAIVTIRLSCFVYLRHGFTLACIVCMRNVVLHWMVVSVDCDENLASPPQTWNYTLFPSWIRPLYQITAINITSSQNTFLPSVKEAASSTWAHCPRFTALMYPSSRSFQMRTQLKTLLACLITYAGFLQVTVAFRVRILIANCNGSWDNEIIGYGLGNLG